MGVDLGDTVAIAGQARDAAGNPTNATTVALTIRLPDGSEVNPSITNPPAVVGEYGYDYVPPVEGHYQWWLRTTGPTAALTGSFDVIGSFPPLIISMDAAREQINAKTRVSDEDVRDIIGAATEMLEGPEFAGHTIVRRTVTERVCAYSYEPFYLGSVPVISITSVTAVAPAVGSWNPATQLQLDRDTGQVRVIYGPPVWGEIDVVYLAGYTSIPPRFAMAARLLVQDLWSTQSSRYGRAGTGYGRSATGGGDVGDEMSPATASQVRALIGAPWVHLGSP